MPKRGDCKHSGRIVIYAGVAELVDAADLKSAAAWREGSNPFSRTKGFDMNDLETTAREIAGLPHDENEFLSPAYEQGEYPAFFDAVQQGLEYLEFSLHGGELSGSGVLPGKFELQTHTVSVHEHTDDVGAPWYFGLVVLNTTTRGVKYSYDSIARFTGYGRRGKYTRELTVGRLMAFNPRKPHSLTFYGEVPTIALFSVVPMRGGEPWKIPVTDIF